jgi:hypothetical protein
VSLFTFPMIIAQFRENAILCGEFVDYQLIFSICRLADHPLGSSRACRRQPVCNYFLDRCHT